MPTVADVVVAGLTRAGTPRVFVVSDATHAFVDAARRQGVDIIRAPDDETACTMAAVSGELTDAPGAVIVSGTHTGLRDSIASAFVGRAPVVVVSAGGGEARELAGVTKAWLDVRPGSAAHWIAHACQLALTEPRGPVLLRLEANVAGAAALPVGTACRPAPPAPPDPDALGAAARLLRGAARPLLLVGLQCRSETDAAWLRAFAEALPAPALVTPRAKGALPDPHPLVIDLLATDAVDSPLVRDADLLVVVGLDPLETPPRAWLDGRPVLRLAATAPEGDVAAAVVGDIGLILEELAPRLRDRGLADWDVARLHALKQAAAAPPSDPRRLSGHRVVETARRLTTAGTIAVFDGAWTVSLRAWPAVTRGEVVIADRAAAGAVAAKLAYPGRYVVGFTEAPSLATAHSALSMLATLGLAVTIVVLDGPAALEVPAEIRALDASPAGFAAVFEAALAAPGPTVIRLQGAGKKS